MLIPTFPTTSDTEWTNIANIVALEIVDAVYGNYDHM